MNAIVGYTGFVGSNIYASHKFDYAYNSKNIESAYGTEPEILVYAGVRAEKYIANSEPEKDYESILEAERNISLIRPEKLVLISTIDVFPSPVNVNEDTQISASELNPYGYNRLCLENMIRDKYPDALIVRLPGLFGKNIKKNFIYDMINIIPSKLREDKLAELSLKEPSIREAYVPLNNGFYQLDPSSDKKRLKEVFMSVGFTAVNFTDSRSVYQFYNLARLWDDIRTALENDLRLLHLATEPLSAAEIYRRIFDKDFINEISSAPANYDFRTKYGPLYGSDNEYLVDRKTVLDEICAFVKNSL